jgi:putative ABC transport system ATP-binding protein
MPDRHWQGSEMTKTPLVEVAHVTKYFGSGDTCVKALDDVSLQVFPTQLVGLLGPSGSGKSTLLNVIGCITEPSSGSLMLDGEKICDNGWLRKDLRRLRLEKIGFIFQSHNLLSFLNVTENISLMPQLFGASPEQASARALALLSYLDVAHRKNARPSQLSGGEAQRVAIARALANHPRIILADEPTAALDSERAGKVMDLLRKIAQEQQAAILVVTHDEKIYDRFDRIFLLRDGKLEETPPA